jgi:hypothetical protein
MGTWDRRSQWCNRLWINDPVVGFFFGRRKVGNEVTQVKRWSLAMLLMSSALVATAAPAFAQSGTFPDPDQRWLLGMGILALTLIIAFLIAWYTPMGPKGGGPRRSVSCFVRKIRRRHRLRQFNGGGADGGGAPVVPSPPAKSAPSAGHSDLREAPATSRTATSRIQGG